HHHSILAQVMIPHVRPLLDLSQYVLRGLQPSSVAHHSLKLREHGRNLVLVQLCRQHRVLLGREIGGFCARGLRHPLSLIRRALACALAQHFVRHLITFIGHSRLNFVRKRCTNIGRANGSATSPTTCPISSPPSLPVSRQPAQAMSGCRRTSRNWPAATPSIRRCSAWWRPASSEGSTGGCTTNRSSTT